MRRLSRSYGEGTETSKLHPTTFFEGGDYRLEYYVHSAIDVPRGNVRVFRGKPFDQFGFKQEHLH